MSFEIVKNLIPGLPQEAYANGVGKYVGVIAHATANNGDSADGERSYESRTFNDAFAHFFVDDVKIEQTADTNYLAYGAGHTANHLGFVHVELCQTTDAAKFELAYAKYVWILAKVLFDRKIPVINGQTLMSHAQTSAKWHETDHTDPIQYLASHGKTWTNLVDDVTSEYKKMGGGTVSTIPTNTIGSLVIQTQLGLNLRESANTTATVLAVVPYNTTCPVLAFVTGWYEIQYGGKTGWVSSQYVSYTAKPVPVVAPVAPAVTPKPIAPVTPTPAPLDYEKEVIRVMVGGKQVIAISGITKATDYAKANYPGQTVVLTCASDGKNWSISVPAVVVPVAPIAPVVVPAPCPVASITPTPDINSVITAVLTDPANVLTLKEMYLILNKIFGGKQ